MVPEPEQEAQEIEAPDMEPDSISDYLDGLYDEDDFDEPEEGEEVIQEDAEDDVDEEAPEDEEPAEEESSEEDVDAEDGGEDGEADEGGEDEDVTISAAQYAELKQLAERAAALENSGQMPAEEGQEAQQQQQQQQPSAAQNIPRAPKLTPELHQELINDPEAMEGYLNQRIEQERHAQRTEMASQMGNAGFNAFLFGTLAMQYPEAGNHPQLAMKAIREAWGETDNLNEVVKNAAQRLRVKAKDAQDIARQKKGGKADVSPKSGRRSNRGSSPRRQARPSGSSKGVSGEEVLDSFFDHMDSKYGE